MTDQPSKEIISSPSDAIRVVEKTGAFLNQVFGEMIKNRVGIVADRIKYCRLHNYLKLSENTTRIMRDKGYSEGDITRVVPLKIAIPLIENATLEENDELQQLWAVLLANAMDLNFNVDIKLRHVSLLREMEPLDLRILHNCYLKQQSEHSKSLTKGTLFERSKIAQEFEISEDLIEASLLNLIRLSCIDPGFLPTSITTRLEGRQRTHSIYVGTEYFTLTLLGVELCMAAASD